MEYDGKDNQGFVFERETVQSGEPNNIVASRDLSSNRRLPTPDLPPGDGTDFHTGEKVVTSDSSVPEMSSSCDKWNEEPVEYDGETVRGSDLQRSVVVKVLV